MTTLIQEAADIGSAFRQYFRVLFALLRQEEETRRHRPGESLMNLFEPVMFVGSMAFVVWFLGNREVWILGSSPVLFYGTGLFAKYFFIYISRQMRSSFVSPRQRYPIERRLDYIFVNIAIRIGDYSILSLLLFSIIYVIFTHDAVPYDFGPVLQACAAIVMLAFGWGILNMIIGRAFWFWSRISPAIARIMVLLSGALFIVDYLPPGVRYVLSFNPMVHAIALFRTGFYPNYPTLVLDRSYLLWCSLLAVVLGLVLERLTLRREK